MAGRLGCGGGPLAFHFSPSGCPQTQMLQEQIGGQRQQRMSMQTAPRAPLEGIELKLFLQLLVRLLAHSTGPDERRQLLQRRVGLHLDHWIFDYLANPNLR
jgi:hypothetical protein